MSNIVATQIRVGMILNVDDELYRVTWTQHVTPGKGVACMQTKLKGVLNGKNLEKRFRSADRVEQARLIERPMQFLYEEPDALVFMDEESFEQYSLPLDRVGDEKAFLKEGEVFSIGLYEDQPLVLTLPKSMVLEVTDAPPEIRKATASSSLRPIGLANGMTVQAPAFIKPGDMVKVNTETMEYIERVKQ